MGASVSPYWAGITEEHCDCLPGFWNDSKAWGNWMAEREKHDDVLKALRLLKVEAVRTCRTEDMSDADVLWVTPDALAADALWLRHLVMTDAPGTRRIVETYAISAGGDQSPEIMLGQDLLDVASIPRYAAQLHVPLMTLHIDW